MASNVLKKAVRVATFGLGGQTVYDKYRKGRHEDKAKEKFNKQVATGKKGLPTDINKLSKQYAEAGKGTDQFFAPIKEQAMRDFNQTTVPNLLTQYGQGSKSSSALNQALGAAASSLHQDLASNFANMKQQMASGLFNQSQNNQLANLQNRLQLNQGANAQGNFWSKAAPLAGLGIGAMAGNPVLGTQIGTAAGQIMN
jgi:hypothetical protein